MASLSHISSAECAHARVNAAARRHTIRVRHTDDKLTCDRLLSDSQWKHRLSLQLLFYLESKWVERLCKENLKAPAVTHMSIHWQKPCAVCVCVHVYYWVSDLCLRCLSLYPCGPSSGFVHMLSGFWALNIVSLCLGGCDILPPSLTSYSAGVFIDTDWTLGNCLLRPVWMNVSPHANKTQ